MRAERGQGRACGALWATGKTWAFSPSRVGAMEGSEHRRMMPGLRSSQAPSGGFVGNRLQGEGNGGRVRPGYGVSDDGGQTRVGQGR